MKRLNKLLKSLFKKRIKWTWNLSLRGSYCFYQKIEEYYECNICKSHHKKLPNINKEDRIFKVEQVANLEMQPEFNEKDLKVYGWVIEINIHQSFYKIQQEDYYGKNWQKHWNHKVYKTKEDGMDAIEQSKISNNWRIFKYQINYRLVPLYSVNQDYYRNITINKILENE